MTSFANASPRKVKNDKSEQIKEVDPYQTYISAEDSSS